MKMVDGWLDNARRVESPHYDERPAPGVIDLVVIHGISLPPGEFGGPWIEALFSGTLDITAHSYFATLVGVRVSAHLFIRRGGEIVQFVSCDARAWHAGVSSFGGRSGCNDFSIGIELEGTDEIPYTDAQYTVLASLIHVLRRHYPGIARERIVGHSHIAPGRKTDPGPVFDWARLFQGLDAQVAGSNAPSL